MKMRRRATIPTPQSLEGTALFYLSRYAASEFSLRRVLQNRMRRAAFRFPDFARDSAVQEKLRAAIDKIVEKHKKSGALNDLAYADMKISSLRRSGRSARVIRQYLAKNGIAREAVNDRLQVKDENEKGEKEDADFKAALILAKRRKLGPYRIKPSDLEQKRKDMAVMARAGFSFDTVRKIIDLSCDDLDDFGF